MERTSQLLVRNQSLFQDDDLLLINPPADALLLDWLGGFSNTQVWTQDFADHRWFESHGINTGFGLIPPNWDASSQVLLFQPREKDRLEMWLHFVAASLATDRSLWLIGENKAGIKSAGKKLQQFFNSVKKSDAARHCVLFEASDAKTSSEFDLQAYCQEWLFGAPPDRTRFVSYPGTFAHGRLDKGSEILLSVISDLQENKRPTGKVLDFGCGIGVLGLSLLKLDPDIKLTLLDSSAAALESTRQSLLVNQMEAELLASDGLNEVTKTYDWIVSNPPFHRGVATNLETAQRFFKQASQFLNRDGKLLIVQNRHLPYETWLKNQFGSVECLDSQSDFKVILAARPKLKPGQYRSTQ